MTETPPEIQKILNRLRKDFRPEEAGTGTYIRVTPNYQWSGPASAKDRVAAQRVWQFEEGVEIEEWNEWVAKCRSKIEVSVFGLVSSTLYNYDLNDQFHLATLVFCQELTLHCPKAAASFEFWMDTEVKVEIQENKEEEKK